MLKPGSVVGIYSKSPSYNGGINSDPICLSGKRVIINMMTAEKIVIHLNLSTQ
jgi:hypothetical protein